MRKKEDVTKSHVGIYSQYLQSVHSESPESLPKKDSISLVCCDIKAFIKQEEEYPAYFKLMVRLHSQLERQQKFSQDDSNTLITLLLGPMAYFENKIYDQDYQDDPFMFGLLANRDKLASVVGNFIILSIPKITPSALNNLFNNLLHYLRQRDEFHLPRWVYHKSIQLSIKHLDKMHMEILCDFYLQNLHSNNLDSDSFYGLRDVALTYFSEEYLNRFLESLIGRMKADSHDRNQQKVLSCLFVLIFNNLEEKQREEIYHNIIKLMISSESLYVRQSLAEILEGINFDVSIRLELLQRLEKDQEYDVRRFANNVIANIERQIEDSRQDKKRAISPVFEAKTIKDADKYMTFQELLKRDLDIDLSGSMSESSYQDFKKSQQQEFKKFKRSLFPNRKQNLIAGLNSSNYDIQCYCWDNLPKCYLGHFCGNNEKKAFVNILFDAHQKPNFVLSEIELIEYIFDHLKSHDTVRELIIQRILKILKSGGESINYREWTNLIWSLLSSDSSEATCKNIIESYTFILKSSLHSIDAKLQISSSLLSVCTYSIKHLSSAILALVKCSNLPDKQLRNYTLACIIEGLSYIDDIKQLDQGLIDALSKINPNCHDQKLIDQVLSFLVYVIAQLGDSPQGQSAITVIMTIVNKSHYSALAVLIKQLVHDYGIANLSILKKLHSCLQNKIAKNPVWQAYDQMHFSNKVMSMKLLRRLNKVKVTHQFNDIFLIASCYIKQGKLNDAYCYLVKAENSRINHPLHTFLKAEIKFEQGNFSEAIGLYKEMLRECPHYIQARIKIYLAYQKLHAFFAADRLRQEIKLLSPQLNLTGNEPGQASSIPILSLEKTVAYGQLDVDQFIKESLGLIKNQPADIESEIVTKFEVLKKNLCVYFSEFIIVDFFNRQAEIKWNDLIRFPHQLPRFMRDLFLGILHSVLPTQSVQFHESYQFNIDCMKNLDQHMTDSGVYDFIDEKITDPSNFLKASAEVLSAYDFIRRFAFSEKMRDACALGLSGDISNAYGLLVGLLQLKHWQLVYEEVDVEPSGTTQHTNEFMTKVLQREQAVIMFVPVIVKKTENNNPTLDEIKYLFNAMQTENFKGKVYFVFGAYEILPIYKQVLNPIDENQRSLGHSFKPMLDYMVNFFNLDLADKNQSYRSLMSHMLYTRIKINFINNLSEDKEFNAELKESLIKMFAGDLKFLDVLNTLLNKIPEINQHLYIASEWDVINNVMLAIDALLFTDMPWFGSNYQLPNTTFANTLKKILLDKKKCITAYLNTSLEFYSATTVSKLKVELTQISRFIQYLDRLIIDVECGLRWRGLSDFQTNSSARSYSSFWQTTKQAPHKSAAQLICPRFNGH